MRFRVRDGWVLRDQLFVPCLRFEPTTFRSLALDGRSEHARHGPERIELVSRPSALPEAIVETDEGPPSAVHEHRERRDRHDLLADELRPLLFRELTDDALDRLLARHEPDPSIEAVAAEPGSVQCGVRELGRDIGGAPLGVLRGQVLARSIRLHADEVRPGDIRGETEMSEHVVDRGTPVGTQEQALGRERDRREHRVASEELLMMSDRSSHADPSGPEC
jgi:hypothetical protein